MPFSSPLINRPNYVPDQTEHFWLPKSLVDKNDETVLSTYLIANRPLFGECYRHLARDIFDDLGPDGGVFIARCVPSQCISKHITFPGDIDLLIIPYDGDNLLLSKTMAIEVKAVRAKFAKQGKSPNEYGFSQAKALLDLGFPYVAVAHLIVSDNSPQEYWQQLLAAQITDANNGTLGNLKPIQIDMLPASLMDRSFGRLLANCPNEHFGLLSAYPNSLECWMPKGRPAVPNKTPDLRLLAAIDRLYNEHFDKFLDTPKWPPKN